MQSFRNFRAPFPEVSAVDLDGRLFWHTLGCQGCKHHNGKPLTTQYMPEVGVIKPNHLHYVSETPALKKRKGVLYFSGKGALLNRNIHIVDIIFASCTAREAIAKCEKSPEAELRSMITEVMGEDMEGTDIEEMLARLSTRLGISEDSEVVSDEVAELSSEEIKVNPFDGKQEGGTA